MKNLISFIIFLFFSVSYGLEIRSDIRIEIISQIKVLKEEKESLKKESTNADYDKKAYIEKRIDEIEKKINKLIEILENYEKSVSNTG